MRASSVFLVLDLPLPRHKSQHPLRELGRVISYGDQVEGYPGYTWVELDTTLELREVLPQLYKTLPSCRVASCRAIHPGEGKVQARQLPLLG